MNKSNNSDRKGKQNTALSAVILQTGNIIHLQINLQFN